MDRLQFEIKLKGLGHDIPKENQFEFYNNSYTFLNQKEKKILINIGGMGLGKTISICLSFLEFKHNFEGIFIATPYSKVKRVWCNELNKIGVNKFVEWISKKECVGRYHKDINDCVDECEHRKHLKNKDGYTSECHLLLDNLKFPLIASDWYDNNGEENCLLDPIRLGLKSYKIGIGDYIPIMNKSMMNLVIFNERKERQKSLLIIDEAHRFPERVENYFSKELDLTYWLNTLKKSEEKYKISESDIKSYEGIEEGIKILKKIEKKLKKESKTKENRCNQMRYNYIQFETDFNSLGKISFNNFFIALNKSSRLLSKEDYEEEGDPLLKRLFFYLQNWREKYFDENYGQYFQYSEFGNKNVKLKVACDKVSNIIPDLLKEWNKVILISGTIHQEFTKSIGLLEQDYIQPPSCLSFSIKRNVLIYPNDSFNNEKWRCTFDKNKDDINKLVSIVKGRILFMVKNKEQGDVICNQIKDRTIFNLGRLKGDELKKQVITFSSSEDGIAVLNVLGRVEGENFLDENDKSVQNVIIYGYPHMIPNFEYEDKLNSYKKEFNNNEKIAKAYLQFIPRGQIIHQAATRAKRNKDDNPIILLWGDAFNKFRDEFHFLPDDLKGEIIYDFNKLIDEIKRRDNDRSLQNASKLSRV